MNSKKAKFREKKFSVSGGPSGATQVFESKLSREEMEEIKAEIRADIKFERQKRIKLITIVVLMVVVLLIVLIRAILVM